MAQSNRKFYRDNGAAAYDEMLRSVDERKLFVRESE